jgi:hypothetical protein
MTAILDILFVVLKILAWAVLLYFGGKTVLSLRSSRLDQESVPELLWRNKGRLLLVTISTVVVAMATSVETAYRPKTVVQPKNPQLEQRLKKVDSAPLPTVKPAPGRDPEEAYRKNREENEAARREFEKLPERK